MDINKLSNEELTELKTMKGAYAVVLGYLKSERGKIAPTQFNKLVAQLNYPKQNKEELREIVQEINEDKVLSTLYDMGYTRQIKLDDIPDYVEDEGSLTEEEVFSQVTNFLIDNEDNNARLRELRKLQGKGIHMERLMKGVKEHLAKELMGMPRAKYLQTEVPKPKKGDKSLIICFSDWHIGTVVYNENTEGYDFKKLTNSVEGIINYALDVVRDFNIKNVYVFHAGDISEHISMRDVTQSYESEFNATEQISKGIRLITDILIKLSKHVHITFGAVSGNHDRFNGKKENNIYNDSSVYIVLDTLFMLQDTFGQLPNVDILDNRKDTKSLITEVAGKTIKLVHGDYEKKNDDKKISKHIKTKPIDYLFMGHIHHTRITQEDYARFSVTIGSTVGANNFCKDLNLPDTYANQMLVILTEGSYTPTFIPIMLKGGNIV